MLLFFQLIDQLPEPVRILDVGGTANFWKTNTPETPKQLQITLLNLMRESTEGLENVIAVAGDARRMNEFANRSFDICFSNSVIEHVGTYADQLAAAQEMRRVARNYFVQTPNRWFPLEPHFLFPGWQFLPLTCRVWLHQSCNLGWMPRQPNPQLAEAEVRQIRLLTFGEMRQLFPEATIHRETLGPLTKSFMAVRAT